MSLPEARSAGNGAAAGKARSRVWRGFVALALAAPLLTACGDGGFRPLYGSASLGGSGVSEKLAQVEIATIPGRVGQRIRNELIFQTTGGGTPLPPAYKLEIAIRESVSQTLVKPTGDVGGGVYNLDANFRLVRLADKKIVFSGTSYGRAAFERFTSIFANVRAREDAENRAAKTVGTELQTRLAAYLSNPA